MICPPPPLPHEVRADLFVIGRYRDEPRIPRVPTALIGWEYASKRPGTAFGRWLTLLVWLSPEQAARWVAAVPCDFCGAEAGAWCSTDRGFTPAPTYTHTPRRRSASQRAGRLPDSLFPAWAWWASHAAGEDPHALAAALNAYAALTPASPPSPAAPTSAKPRG